MVTSSSHISTTTISYSYPMAHNFIRSIQKIGLHTKVLLVREELSDHKLTRDCLHIQAADRSTLFYCSKPGWDAQ